jgi:NAD(P)-dependent dehydrogenase (short-subunit alcohol dehydrogenase family)
MKNKPRHVVITGGTKGLGRAMVAAFLARGDTVWSLSRTVPPDPQPDPHLRYLVADVRDRAQLDGAVAIVRKEADAIDVWINNAGFGKPVPFHDGDNALWDDMFAVNFWGTVHGTRAALSALARPGGVIINIASVTGFMAPKGHSAYATAKAAVIALTRANAVEFAEAGIRVNAIAPGPLDTEGFRAAGGDPEKRAKTIPTRKMVQPAEIAAACVFLAEPNASLTGHTLVIDGGSLAVGCYA